MAIIIKNFDPIVNTAGHENSEALIANYWKDGGEILQEKIFPVPFWKVHQMFSVGDDNQIVLRVRNIKNPRNVLAEWMPFEEGLVAVLDDDSIFYVISHTAFYGPIPIEGGPTAEGISNNNTDTPHENIICGRIGKSDSGQHFVFFLAAKCEIITPGGGGIGPACGAKIPPGGAI